MRTIRRELGNDVEELVEHAERLMDWKYYVQRYPWASVGAAALLGYFLIPQRIVTLPTDEHTLARLADRLPVYTKPSAEQKKKQQSMLGWLVSMGTGMAMRAAGAYLSQQLGKIVAQQSGMPEHHQPAEVHHP
jgi:hypothetical protein